MSGTTVRERVVSSSPALLGAAGVVILLIVWTVAAAIVPGRALPSPAGIVAAAASDGWEFYWANLSATFGRMVPGYLIGVTVALTIAAIVLLLPSLDQVANQVGVVGLS